MRNKKSAIMATSLVIFLAGLTACGGTTSETTTSQPSDTSSDGTTETLPPTTTDQTSILTPVEGQTNLSELASVTDDSSVFIRGVVYSKAREGRVGYWIADLTGCAFIYENSDNVNYGDVMEIYGSKSSYYGLPQVKYGRTPGEKIGETSYLPTYEKTSIRSLYNFKDAPDVSLFGKNITVEGKVVSKVEDFMTNWYLQDPVTGDEFKVDYNSGENYVGLHKDKFIEIDLQTYSFNDTTKIWSVFVDGHAPHIVEKQSPTLSTADKLEAVKNQLIKKYNNFIAYRDLDLISTDALFGSNITYVSGNTGILSNDGKITTPEVTTDVELTATIEIDGETISVVLTISVQNLLVESLKTVMESFESKLATNESYTVKVATTGYITATRGSTGYWIQDGDVALYVKGNVNGYVKGQTVNVVGTLKYKNQPIIESPTYQEVSSKSIAEPEIMVTTVSDLVANNKFNVRAYSKYITIKGKLVAKAGSYGNSYTIADVNDESKTISIHSASNVAGFATVIGKVATFKCFVQDYSGGFRIFATNRDGELIIDGTPEEKIAIAKTYLNEVMPSNGEILTTDIDLAKSHIVLPGLSYTWTSSDENVISSKGLNTNGNTEKAVILTCKIAINDATESVSFNYTVAAKKAEGNANDLMFTTLMRGAKNDKIITISNTTGSDVSLKDYKVYSVQNSGIGANSFDIAGSNAQAVLTFASDATLKNNETLVLYHEAMETTLLKNIPESVQKISCPNQNGVVAFNGSDGDTLYLLRNTSIVDKIGTFEKVLSQGQPTSWEERYFSSNSMIVRQVNNPTPMLDWTDFDATDVVYKRMASIGAGTNYEVPEFIYNWASILK